MSQSSIILPERAPAKVNLFLHVDQMKPNGRHDLQSLVVFAGPEAADEVSFQPGDGLSLQISGVTEGLQGDQRDNLVFQAARAVLKAADSPLGAKLSLEKQLPVAAGIGGGSADAAATLRLLIRVFDLDPAIAEHVAPTLGGDVPVALLSSAALMEGEGERVTPITLPGPMPALLVNPRLPCPTGPIFSAFDGASGGQNFAPVALPRFKSVADCIDWCAQQRNDLEPAAIALVPEISDVLQGLETLEGARLTRMSGSGATCFTLFETHKAAQDAEASLKGAHPGWWIRYTALS